MSEQTVVTEMETAQQVKRHADEARRIMRNMAGVVRREDLTGWVKDRGVYWHYRDALRHIVAVEDLAGVDAAARLSDRLTTLRHEATAAGLLEPADIVKAEREVIA